MQRRANILIFPNLLVGNIANKLLESLSSASVFGPILMGMNKPVYALQCAASLDDIIIMTAIAVVKAAEK